MIFSYYTEFLPKFRRGAMISALATFWMAGNIIAAGMYIDLNNWLHYENFPMQYTDFSEV